MHWLALSSLSALLFASAAMLYRKAMRGSRLSPLTASALRALVVVPLLYAVSAPVGVSFSKPAEFYLLAFASTVLVFAVGDALLLYGLSHSPVGVVYPAAYSFSLFAAFFSHLLLGEAVTAGMLAAAVLVVLGVALTYRGASASGDYVRGLAAGLGASISWGLGITLNKPALDYATPLELTLVRLLMLIAIAAPALAREAGRIREAVNLPYLALGGLLGIGLGPLVYLQAIADSGVTGPSIVASSSPVLAVVLAAVFLGEKPSRWVVFGALLVFLGVTLLYAA
uniref:DMT family transporter n=1 Tax=Thermofilum pendens TaxID=2269 RepID=A0A7J3X866_THEPE